MWWEALSQNNNNYNLSLYSPLYLLIYYTHLSIHTANPDTVL